MFYSACKLVYVVIDRDKAGETSLPPDASAAALSTLATSRAVEQSVGQSGRQAGRQASLSNILLLQQPRQL